MKQTIIDALSAIAAQRAFPPGAIIRHRASFAPDMFLLLSGEAQVRLDADRTITVGRHSLVGEMGFLTGQPATAEVRAITECRALVLDHPTLERLAASHAQEAVALSRDLARTIAARQAQNAALLADAPEEGTKSTVTLRRCATPEDLLIAQQVRYAVYCGEFNRPSPYADHEAGTIIDDLDAGGTSFLAFDGEKPVGTVRVNLARDGDLGILPGLYGMANDPDHPEKTSVITKYAILESHRGGTTYMRLFGAIAGFLLQTHNVTRIYIDCVPFLARFYATMGFERSAEDFMHYENGLSVPMCLDIPAYAARMPFDERMAKNRWR